MGGSIDLSIGGNPTERRESWTRQRAPVIKPRGDYTETATDEEGANGERRMGGKRVRQDDDSDMEKRRTRQIRFGKEQRMGQ